LRGKSRAQLLHARVQIGGDHRFLPIVVIVIVAVIDNSAGRTRYPRGPIDVVNAFEIDADFVFFRRPALSGRIAPFTSTVLTTKLDDGLISRGSQEMQRPGQAGIRRKTKLVKGFLYNFLRVRDAEIADIYAVLNSSHRFHLLLRRTQLPAPLATLSPPAQGPKVEDLARVAGEVSRLASMLFRSSTFSVIRRIYTRYVRGVPGNNQNE
jgi:hypothetical protein